MIPCVENTQVTSLLRPLSTHDCYFLLLKLEQEQTVKAAVRGKCVRVTDLYFRVSSFVLKDWCVLALSSCPFTACLESKGAQSIFIYGSALLKAVTPESRGVCVYISHILVCYAPFPLRCGEEDALFRARFIT